MSLKLFHVILAIVLALFAIVIYRIPATPQKNVHSSVDVSVAEPRIDGSMSNWTTYSRVQATGRLVSIPDVHGDYDGLVKVLREAKLIGHTGTDWTGGNAVLVQTGDVLDRGEQSADCLRLLSKLHHQAREVGGKVVMLMGNHELLNLMGFFHYATPGEDAGFSPATRRDAFDDEKGEFGAFLRTLPAACVVERDGSQDSSVLFVHGGLSSKFLKTNHGDSVEALNRDLAKFLKYKMGQLAKNYNAPLLSEHGPLWNRFFAMGRDEGAVCSQLQETLEITRAGKMVVGHTVQTLSKVGFAPYYFSHRLALEHHPDGSHTVIECKP